jgi:hypothetical protein
MPPWSISGKKVGKDKKKGVSSGVVGGVEDKYYDDDDDNSIDTYDYDHEDYGDDDYAGSSSSTSSPNSIALNDPTLLSLSRWRSFNPFKGPPLSLNFMGSYEGEPVTTGVPEVAFVGRSNAGKSSLLNALIKASVNGGNAERKSDMVSGGFGRGERGWRTVLKKLVVGVSGK